MVSQIGYYDTLKSVTGKVFSYLASITLTGTDGKTITCTQDTSLDEAVAMSSKAPKNSPALVTPSLGVASATSINALKVYQGSLVSLSDTNTKTITIDITGMPAGNGFDISFSFTCGGTGQASVLRLFCAGMDSANTAFFTVTDMIRYTGSGITIGATTKAANSITFTIATSSPTGYIAYWLVGSFRPAVTREA